MSMGEPFPWWDRPRLGFCQCPHCRPVGFLGAQQLNQMQMAQQNQMLAQANAYTCDLGQYAPGVEVQTVIPLGMEGWFEPQSEWEKIP